MSETARLVSMFVRATGATRVLEIGTGAAITGLAIADALPPGGRLITLERDAAMVAQARETFAAAGHAHRVVVMAGDAARYLHKMAGPFDLVFQDGDARQYDSLHDRLVRLLAPSATLITNRLTRAGDYNRVLATDPRLATTMFNIAEGVAVSVRRGRLRSNDDA